MNRYKCRVSHFHLWKQVQSMKEHHRVRHQLKIFHIKCVFVPETFVNSLFYNIIEKKEQWYNDIFDHLKLH